MKNTIRRPSRFQQRYAEYELLLSGMAMGEAIAAVRRTEENYNDVAAEVQEGNLFISPDAWDALHNRHERTRKKLADCRNKMPAGLTCANRSC